MIDWAARIDDLADYLAREHRMEDRAALEILLSALAPCPRVPALWIALETNYFARDCTPGWFAFGGGAWHPYSLAQIRARQPWRAIVAMMAEWLDEPEADRLLIEPDWERYPFYDRLYNALFVVARCLRLRVIGVRSAKPLATLDEREEDRRAQELWALTREILVDRAGARPAQPPVFREPEGFLYYAELLQRCSPWYRDWGTLLRSLATLPVRRAYLMGRSEINEEDLAILARVMADGVPPWVRKALAVLAEGPARRDRLHRAMELYEASSRSARGAAAEINRLAKAGIIQWNLKKLHWRIAEEHAKGLADLCAGRIFQVGSVRLAG